MEEAEAIKTLGDMESDAKAYLKKFGTGELTPQMFAGYAGEGNFILFGIQAGYSRAYVRECLERYPASEQIAALSKSVKDLLLEIERTIKPAFKS
jgi:hypothetical protein